MRARRRAAAIAGAVLFAAATLALFVVSRGKWSDAIIDSGSEWIVPDALARGDLLYRDIIHWFGPVTPYYHALFFRLFGSSFVTLATAGAVASAGILSALFVVLRRASGRSRALVWTALAVPALVFMPNAGGALIGMGFRNWHAAGFTLAALALGARRGQRPAAAAFLAGGLAGLAGLCRTEWGLAACAALLLAGVLGAWPREARRRLAAVTLLGFAIVFGGVLGVFLALAGPAAVLRDGHVLLTGIPPETRVFLLRFSGIGDWPRGLAQMAYSGAMWLGAATAVELVALGGLDPDRRRRRLARLAGLLALLGVAAVLGGASGAVLFSAAPLLCTAALVFGLRRAPRPGAARLAALGFLGLLLSYRRPFHIGDSAYVAAPLLFAFASAAGLLALVVARERASLFRRRLGAAFATAGAVLVAAAFGGRVLQYAGDERVPVRGTSGMLSALPDEAAEIEAVAAAVSRSTPERGSLVCFPEGQVLNFLSGRRVPIRHNLFIPGYLTSDNEPDILEELARHPPNAVVIWKRPASEYGEGFFGESYGRRLRQWIDANYDAQPRASPGASAVVAFRREAAPS